jgi:hypothetical protein
MSRKYPSIPPGNYAVGMSVGEALDKIAKEQGLNLSPVEKAKKRRDKVPLVEASSFVGPWYFMAVIPLYVVAGDNSRGMRKRIGRGGHEKTTTIKTLARWHREIAPYADQAIAGERVEIKLTRLGPNLLDDDNCTASCKYVRDSVAMLLGCDDSPRSPLIWSYDQRKEAAYGVEVRIS